MSGGNGRKILVVSDSHGRNANIRRAIEREAPLWLLLHLGDVQGDEVQIGKEAPCPSVFVAGNCDLFSSLPSETVVYAGAHRLFLTHGHYYQVFAGTRILREEAMRRGCDFALFGHTHEPMIDFSDPDVTVLNPGSISLPRQHGRRPTYIVITEDEEGKLHPDVKFL